MPTPTTSPLIEKETDGYIEKPTSWKKGINTKEIKALYNGKLKPTTLRKYFSTPTSPLIEGIIEEWKEAEKEWLSNNPVPNEMRANNQKEYYSFSDFVIFWWNKKLTSSLQKVESETVERCLKILKDTYKFPFNILE